MRILGTKSYQFAHKSNADVDSSYIVHQHHAVSDFMTSKSARKSTAMLLHIALIQMLRGFAPDVAICPVGLSQPAFLPGLGALDAGCLMRLSAYKCSRHDGRLSVQGVGPDVSPKGCLLMERDITSKATSDGAFDPSQDSLDNLKEIQQGR